jgi:iron(III) transport system permease protein
MLWLLVLFFAVLCLAPLMGLLLQLEPIGLFLGLKDPILLRSLSTTLVSGIVASLLSCIIGILFARQFAKHEWSGKRGQRLLLLFPYLIPNFILAIAFVTAWNPGTGLLNTFVRFPGGLYGLGGMTWL